MQSRNKSRPYRLASPTQTNKLSPLSDDSLSEKGVQTFKKRRPRSAFISCEPPPQRSTRIVSTPSSTAPSVYLIEVKNNNRPTNSFGLTKTITYVWRNNHQNKKEDDFNKYPRYSVEQVPPMIDNSKRTIPISSRHITLQRGKTDCWQNQRTTSNTILTSTCQNHTGSATNLLPLGTKTQQNDVKYRTKPNGHVISVTTTKRQQPSLLNQRQNTRWNIEGNGKQIRYSNLKWYSADQLQKDNRLIIKPRTKRRQQISDSATDTGSSSEPHNQSAPPVLQRKISPYVSDDIPEVFENTTMNNKQNDLIIPDYSSFHREINDTSSPVNHDEEQQSISTSSSKEIQHIETVLNEYSSSPRKRKLNCSASTDEDVDEFNIDYTEDIDQSAATATIQTYRDRLNARINAEINQFRPRILSTEYSQITTLDSGVDIASEQKISQPKIDEQYSEETANQNDLCALSDDSLLDIEPAHHNHDLLLKIPTITHEQSLSLTEESDDFKSYITAITDTQLTTKNERGPSNTSDQYYSAESEFNTSLSFPNNDLYNSIELENVSDDDKDKQIHNNNNEIQNLCTELSPSSSPKFDFKLPSFGDWIDHVFTTFLAETNQHSTSTSRSSSIISIQTSQNTIDTSSSQVLTVIENTKKNQHLTIISTNPNIYDEINQTNSLHRRSQSWPNNEQQQQQDEQNIKEVINERTMQNNNFYNDKTSAINTDYSHSDDENFSFSNIMNKNNVDKVEEKEHDVDDDEKHIEIEIDNNKPLIQLETPNDSSAFSYYEEFHSRAMQQHHQQLQQQPQQVQQQQQQHTDSHDSLLQTDHLIMNHINTAASSTDDLSTTNQLSSSVFHSKDSALGLSDDNLNGLQTNPHIINDDDDDNDNVDDDDDDDDLQRQISSSSLQIQQNEIVDNNVIQDNANNNIDKNEMTCEHINDDKNFPINNSTMMCINDQTQLLSPPYLIEHAERTVSSSSSEQLIPKEKQTGMYYPAFGSTAAIHLAEKYNCEWLESITSPTTNTFRRSLTTVDNENKSDSRIFRQHQTLLGDDDEFYLSLQTLQPSHSCPNLNHSFIRESLRERSYSLTTLDAYARLDITRDTLEQMWLSLLDLAFSDKDDIELGEYKLRHIIGLSNSYTNINDTLIEKSRSHGDIFSTTNKNQKLTANKSKSFDVTSLTKPIKSTNDPADVGLLQGAAISEPFVDRIDPISTHSDTEMNLLDNDNDNDNDNDSIRSFEQDNLAPEEEYSPTNNQISLPTIKEPLNYVFHYPHQLDNDDYDFETDDDITHYLPETTLTMNHLFGEEDKQLCMSLGFDDDEATAALAAAVVQPRDIQAILADYRPHSLSTIPSSRDSQYSQVSDDSDADDNHEHVRKNTISIDQEVSGSDKSINGDEEDDDDDDDDDIGEIESNIPSPNSRALSPIPSYSQTPPLLSLSLPEQNQQIKLSFSNIDHDAWERSISEPIYSENLSVQQNNDEDLFSFTDNITAIIPIEKFQESETYTVDLIEPSISLNEHKSNHFIEQIDDNNLIDFSSQEDYIETMNTQQENKSTNSTRTSMSSIHDTHLDPNELAYRLTQLHLPNTSSPPKKTLADELAELGEQHNRFETDSLDHSPSIQDESQHNYQQQLEEIIEDDSLHSTPHTYSTTTPPPGTTEHLTTIASNIRQINQEKPTSSSRSSIVEDIHGHTNNQYSIITPPPLTTGHITKVAEDIRDINQAKSTSSLHTIVEDIHAQTTNQYSTPTPLTTGHLTTIASNIRELNQEKSTSSRRSTVDDIYAPINNQYSTTTPTPLSTGHLTRVAEDIREINQAKSTSSRRSTVDDIHAQTNNQYSTPTPLSTGHLTTIANNIRELNQEKPTSSRRSTVEDIRAHTNNQYSTPTPLSTEHLTTIAKDIRQINQEKSTSSLRTIVEDIHAQTNNQYLTKIVDYHYSPPIANLRTVITDLHQTPIGKFIPRPQRPTHLELNTDEEMEENEQISSPILVNNVPVSSNIISDLEQQLSSYKVKTPSPSLPLSPSPPPLPSPSPPSLPISQIMPRKSSETSLNSTRYNTQRIDKVSDLEIMKQGKGFKIGYVDRQGTDQRVILTKRIEAGPDVMARDPHVRLPYKGRKILSQVYSSILYTNGYNAIQEDKKFEHSSEDIEVPIIGTNPQHFDESDMISIDIDGPSTMLNSICESIVITQGSVYSNNVSKPVAEKPITHPIPKSIFDNTPSHSSSAGFRHVVKDYHEEYLFDRSQTPTPVNKKVEVIDTWKDRTVIDGSSATWRSSSLPSHKATKRTDQSNAIEQFIPSYEPNTVQTRIAPSHDVKYRISEEIDIPDVFDWNDKSINTPIKSSKTTRDIALSPIIVERHYHTSSTSPIEMMHEKIDRSCQYSPHGQHDFGLQCHFENLTSSTQVSSYDLPNFLITHGGTQTIHDSNHLFDDSGIHTHLHAISPSLSMVSSENQHTNQPYTISGTDYIHKINEQRTPTSALTVTQFTDGHYYLPANDNNNNNQLPINNRSTTLERSADSGILVDEQSSRNRHTKANFALQVDIKGSSSDSEDISEVAQRPIHRKKSSNNDNIYEHRSELVITTRNASINDKRYQQAMLSSAKEIEQQIIQLRRERAHILELLSLNWSRSNIWVELTEAKLNYIIGETDALLRSLSFDASPVDNERVKIKMHQYEEDMAELTRQRLAIYRERLEDSKKQLDMKIDELELKKSSIGYHTSHYSTLEYTPRVNHTNKRSKSYLSTSAENLSNMPVQDSISSHPHLLDISFLTSAPSNQNAALPPRYPRSPRYTQQQEPYRTVYRPTPRYPTTINPTNTENRYDYPRFRSTSYVTPSSNLSNMQGLSKSQQAILDETDRLVKDSQQFHNESASQFERARESLLSSETPIRLARANMAASRLSPNSAYLPNDVTLAELFKYEQSLAKETAKNTRTYSSISTTAES
ncbi:unnamed protein product [Adineta steineri]|uniref:Uncharacterized protein n=1 Tax=Adineta steineri TaxID=433720 RepID=A0A815E7F7_9BILA|nr:unnamed protein product [Adineta steineri]